MPWPKDHKSQTRERILQAAAGAFRARGVSGVRVEEIMSSAGLTHGGFYSHFASKEDLLSEALEHAAAQTMESFDKLLDAVPAEHRLRAMIEAYLSSAHAAHPDRGCPVAALGPELVRASKKTRERLARAVKRRIEWMRTLLPPQKRESLPEASLIGATACMIGGLILARSVQTKDSDAILQACREFLRVALRGESSEASDLPQSESLSSERPKLP
jgi:TetR/AcrR family transcriptional regulator, transcriptional repressor for nem operon